MSAYSRALQRWPMPVKSASAAALFGCGDAVAQCQTTPGTHDLRRTVSLMGFGAVLYAPSQVCLLLCYF